MNSLMQGNAGMSGPPPQPQGTENQGDFAGANVEPLDNGYNLNTHYDPKDAKKGYPEPRRTTHSSRQDVLDHLDDILAKHEKGKGEKKGKR